jgi:hypothetical protein
MGAPVTGIKASSDASAEALLSAFKNIPPAEMRRHATVFNYWLSIRGDRQFPPIRDLDPLEISDAGPYSVLLEMVGGGEDAEIRHLGQAIKMGLSVEKASDAPRPSLLSCILDKLPIVASSREAFAFEDEFQADSGRTHCWVTLLPFSATGTWIDYVYGFVSLHPPAAGAEAEAEAIDEASAEREEFDEPIAEAAQDVVEPEPAPEVEAATFEPEVEPEPEVAAEDFVEPQPEPEVERKSSKAGFSAKLFESLASVGFYGRVVDAEPQPAPEPEPEPASVLDIANALIAEAEEARAAEVVEKEEAPVVESAEPEPAAEVQPEPEPEPQPDAEAEPEPVAELQPEAEPESQPDVEAELEPEAVMAAEPEVEEQPEAQPEAPVSQDQHQEPVVATEGLLQTKLTEVRAKADEARAAKLRANAALYEGLSAAYDFALDAEENAEEYLKLVEAQGLKIQLRSPMKPVVKLAFDGLCDDATIAQLEAVLAWALKHDLPRGTLAERIEEEGGLGSILNGQAKAA